MLAQMGELVSMNQIICEAIKSKRTLSLNYGGGARVVEPHCYGVSRSGEELLRAYQTSGHSNLNSVDTLTLDSLWALVREWRILAYYEGCALDSVYSALSKSNALFLAWVLAGWD